VQVGALGPAWALIPAHNEAPRLGEVLARLDLPVLVVDDRSQDGTARIALEHGATVIPSSRPGYAGAIATGHAWMRERGIHRCVQLDADGQHPPEAVHRLLEGLSDANLVTGSRQGTTSPSTWDRKAGNALLSMGVRALTRESFQDVTSGFWACDSKASAMVAGLRGPVADANIRVLAVRAGLRVRELSVDMPCRSGGASMHDGWHGVRNLGRSIRAMASAAR
jgi:glycosyltransferase involved in cell wall biosynthesis